MSGVAAPKSPRRVGPVESALARRLECRKPAESGSLVRAEALACTAVGARGGIQPVEEIEIFTAKPANSLPFFLTLSRRKSRVGQQIQLHLIAIVSAPLRQHFHHDRGMRRNFCLETPRERAQVFVLPKIAHFGGEVVGITDLAPAHVDLGARLAAVE